MTSVVRGLSLFCLTFLVSCSNPILQDFSGEIYGTTYSVKIAENSSYAHLESKIKNELTRVDYVFSTYKPSSEISLINNGDSLEWSDEFRNLYEISQKISTLSGGAFSPKNDNDYDFSAIGKGYAIDKIAELVEQNGANNYFIEIGGEIRSKGAKFKGNWIFGIERPINSKKSPYIAFNIPREGISIATSGEYREPNHIWGDGPRDLLSVTVAHESATYADAWATALYVLGKDQGLKTAESNGLAVFFISSTGDSTQSSNWSMISP